MRKLLYVHPEESVAYLIDRIENTQDPTIYLAADGHPDLFTDPVNMKLLVREAQTLGKDIVVVSENAAILSVAKKANIDTITASVKDLERENISETQTSVSDGEKHYEEHDEEDVPVKIMRDETLATAPFEQHTEEIDLEEPIFTPPESEYAESHSANTGYEKVRSSMPRHESPLTVRFIATSFVVLGLLLAGAFFLLSPRLNVVITPKKEALHFNFTATADTTTSSIDSDTGRIPGQMITIEKEVSDTFVASGKSDQAAKAGGEATLYNEYSSAAQSLVVNTRLETKDGKIFRLTKAITVPGATVQGGKVTAPGTISVAVIADKAGIAHNIEPSEFSIPGFAGTAKFGKIYAKSAKSMTGGSAKEGYIATAEDLEKAKASLQTILENTAKDEVGKNIPKGSVILSTATQQSTPEFSIDTPDDQGKFTARLKATFTVFTFSENDIAALAEQQLSKRLVEDQKSLPATRVIAYEDEVFGTNKTTLTFTVKVNELVSGVINTDELKNLLAGKGETEIQTLLKEYDTMESAEVIFSPMWISLAPENTNRITISVEEQ